MGASKGMRFGPMKIVAKSSGRSGGMDLGFDVGLFRLGGSCFRKF